MTRRALLIQTLLEHPIANERDKTLREHLAADRQLSLQLIEAMDTARYVTQDQQSPPLTEDPRRLRDSAIRVRMLVPQGERV